MSHSRGTQLGQSWVVDDDEGDPGNISWAEQSDDSEVATLPTFRKSPRTQVKRSPRQNRVGSRNVSTTDEPEFMMPSVESLSPEKRVRSSALSPQSHIKNRQTRAVSKEYTSTIPEKLSRRHSVDSNVPAVILQVGEYILEILGSTLKKLKQPISWALAAYLFAGILVLVQNLLTSSISHALSPICRIPGASYLNLPICTFTSRYASDLSEEGDTPMIESSSGPDATSKQKKKSKGRRVSQDSHPTPEFDTLMSVQSQFSALIDSSSSGTALRLPLDMKRSETSIRDLKQIVKFSTIPSKNELVHEFDGFVETARIASFDLQKFNSHVGRSVDNVLSTTRWTGRALHEISAGKANRGIIPSFVQDRLLAPFQPLKFNEGRVLEQYIVHSRVVSDEIARLVDEATGLLSILGNLEDRLDVIHGIALRDGVAAKADRDEVLSQLWTFLGGNRSKLGKVDNQLRLLGRVSEYRKMAYAHVSSTVVKLQSMGAELEELRSRVGAPEVLRDTGRDVPLDVHLEAIRLGVERLEGQREKAREVETGYARRVVEAGQAGQVHPEDTTRLVEAS